MSSSSAFFYGTLLHPKVIKRVLGHNGENLKICPAVLLEHTRHHVKDCDYPAVIPYAKGHSLFGRELSQEERSVRGNVVTGLTDEDMELLDVFEGDEYTREKVHVHVLGTFEPLNDTSEQTVPAHAKELPSEFGDPIETDVYIWAAPTSLLDPKLWSYDTFIRDNAWKWVGPTEDRESYLEVDRRRQMNGNIRN
ncbi:hypothetical protein BD410DRAFT_899874 [Rickenella mellea]|uniref:Putative gamma-glutamylcyclotransferase n=1 Tax=Rickenella mellea TaxID=50990 RepID=A0A4Y7PYB8_9AGAM|nr:hypothetical protein BD410DRAFT_899874 [Rickenella mellea]